MRARMLIDFRIYNLNIKDKTCILYINIFIIQQSGIVASIQQTADQQIVPVVEQQPIQQ